MRRLVLFGVLAAACAVPAVAWAVGEVGSEDGTLSVKNGAGKVSMQFNGSAVGRITRGTIKIVDPVAGDGAGADVWGCDSREVTNDIVTVCSGSNLRFRAVGGRYRIRLSGTGVYLSAIGRGGATLNGWGDDPDIPYDGVFSLNDGPYHSLPDTPQSFTLAAPAGS
jgi:hypothetical protein